MKILLLSAALLIGFCAAYYHFAPRVSITVPPVSVDERKSIESTVDSYYEALRKEDYELAASFYDREGVEGAPFDLPHALKLTSELTGIPEEVKLEALRIDGNTAKGEIIIQRKGKGPVSYVMTDETGNHIGTWARTLNFIKREGVWKISKDSSQTISLDNQELKRALESLIEDPESKERR